MARRVRLLLGILFGSICLGLRAETLGDYGMNPKDLLPSSDYELRFVGLQVGTMTGIFRFEWKGPCDFQVPTYKPQKGSTFSPMPPIFCFWVKPEWKKLDTAGWCGTGLQSQLVEPGRVYFLLIDLTSIGVYQKTAMAPGAEKMVVAIGGESSSKEQGFCVSDPIVLPLYKALDTSQ